MNLISKARAITEHKKLWDWLVNNPNFSKSRYFIDNNITIYNTPVSNCYCCEYSDQNQKGTKEYNSCYNCPLKWGNEDSKENRKKHRFYIPCCDTIVDKQINCGEGLFSKWAESNVDERRKLAEQIRDLPEIN